MTFYKHILVVRFSAMGDVAMTLPVIKSLAEKYPDLKITFLTRGFFAPIFDDLENVEVFEADLKGRHKGIVGLKKLADELAALEIDAVADLHDVLRTNILKLFFRFKGIPVKQIDKGRREKKQITSPERRLFEPLKSSHQRYVEVFKNLNVPVDLEEYNRPLPPKKSTSQLKELLGEKQEKWLGVAPFAQHVSKIYPQDLMKQVLNALQKEENLRIFLFGGGQKEIDILQNWEREFQKTVSVAGKFSFQDELVLISNLNAMLSMDSGNGHLAANYGVPVLTLWGLTHPYTGFAAFRQPSENWLLPDLKKYPAIPTSVYGKKIPKGYEDAMATIPPEKVVEKVKTIIDL